MMNTDEERTDLSLRNESNLEQQVVLPDECNIPASCIKKTISVRKGIILKYPCLKHPAPLPKGKYSQLLASAQPSSLFSLKLQTKPLHIKLVERHRHLNAEAHRTYYYAIMEKKGEALVVRRGTPVRFSLLLDRPYGTNDVLFIELTLQDIDRAQFADGSYVRVMVMNTATFDSRIPDFTWCAICDLISDNGRILHLQVRPPHKTPIGHWGMRCLATSENYAKVTEMKTEIYIIANPWGKDFIGNPDAEDNVRNDHVLADSGLLFTGLEESPTAVPWRFGQFDQDILPIAITLLKGCDPLFRSHVFKVVHHLSYIMGDKKGIVVEKKKPAKPRSGSPAVLFQYAKSKYKPIPGSRQLYVAPCAFITVCRALGIPARPVTFYSVIPDNDGGLFVDRYYHTMGLSLHNVNHLNMWSYVVLPEVMAQRPDLPQPFSASGWQCVSQHGPCSVDAVRAGPIYRWKPYCTDFVYRMVKASYIYLKVEEPAKPCKVVPPRSTKTCTIVATKAAGSWKADNITGHYVDEKKKAAGRRDVVLEGTSNAEDASKYFIGIPANYCGGKQQSHAMKCQTALSSPPPLAEKSSKPSYTGVPMIDTLIDNNNSISGFYYDEELDVDANLETHSSWWGEPVVAAILVRSNIKDDSTAFISIEISAVSVKGEFISSLKALQQRVQLKPCIEMKLRCQVSFAEYNKSARPGDSIRVNANIHIEEHDYDDYFEKFVGFLPLKVILKVPQNPANEKGEVFLQNVSGADMKGCSLSVGEVDSSRRVTLFSDISDETKGLLQIRKVDNLRKKNGTEHNTDLFELMWRQEDPHLVIRRGKPFYLKITLSRPYNPQDDAISFIFTMSNVEFPNHGQGTLVAVPLEEKTPYSGKQSKLNWHAFYEGGVDNTISVQIVPSANCLIGKWSLEIDTKLSQSRMLSYKYASKIYILFNPWCSSDEVYMRDDDERAEFVLAESGLIFRGTHKLVKPTVWKFSQFDKDILDCCLMLIKDVGKVPVTSWNDPIKISRAMSAAINSPDDNGVVAGNWTEDFGGGADPWSWIGSKAILQKYFAKKKPVKYGQCWVFAGVLTTVCRALGIPARPVTCYSCGHDTKNSLTLDYFFDDQGKSMDELQQESIWNFHVWVEAWMKRPDIGKEFDGWQVVDATPQELSDDQYRCGPTSVYAIKTGQIQRPYDGPFAFSMVNADVVYWQYFGPTQPLKLVQRDTKRVGKSLITKTVGAWNREDITNSYKHPETSLEERSTMFAALKRSGNIYSRYYLNEEFNDIKFDFKLVDDIVIGSSFRVTLKMKNKNSSKDYRVAVNLSVSPVIYTGKSQGVIKTHCRDLTVERKSEDEVSMEVSYDEYAEKLVSQCSFNVVCHAHVKDIEFDYHAEDDFRVRQPDIKIALLDKAIVGAAVRVSASFVNPLPVAIPKGVMTLQGGGIIKNGKTTVKNVQPGMKVSEEFIIHPQVIGRHTVVAKFSSPLLDDVDGFLTVFVEESSDAV